MTGEVERILAARNTELLRERDSAFRTVKHQSTLIRAMRSTMQRLRKESQDKDQLIEFYRNAVTSSMCQTEEDLKKKICELYDVHYA